MEGLIVILLSIRDRSEKENTQPIRLKQKWKLILALHYDNERKSGSR